MDTPDNEDLSAQTRESLERGLKQAANGEAVALADFLDDDDGDW